MRLSLLSSLSMSLCFAATASAVVFNPTPVELGRVSGELTEADPVDDDGKHFDLYSVELDANMPVLIAIASEAFDTYLEIVTPDGERFVNDDFAGSTDSGYEFWPEVAGTYRIRVTSFSEGEVGAYELTTQEIGPGYLGEMQSFDAPFEGSLTVNGAGPASEVGASAWYEARAGERLHFRVTSPDFDTIATLVGPDGAAWFNDDANDLGPDGTDSLLDSTIDALAPTTGLYHLTITPYEGEELGDFTVVATLEPPVVLEVGQETPTMGYAGSAGVGRMFGVFVGISDYEGEDSDLYGCSDDARFAAQAFRERGLMGVDDQLILTDDEATIEGVRDGVTWLVERAGPDDVTVFFYSGHGGVVTAAEDEPYDIDGTDETLSLYDGQLSDTTFTDDFEELDADTALVVIDACQSGGFARDFVSQPGRIGIFSSDEDVLSDVAEPYLAGGYVSYFFRQAVIGHADGRPKDGQLQAGELTDFFVEGFVNAHEHMNDPTDADPYQRVILERGSVRWDDALWIYPRLPSGELSPIPEINMDTPPDTAPECDGSCEPR